MALIEFLMESLAIEGIHREPTNAEVKATMNFFSLRHPAVEDLNGLQAVYAPGHPIRDQKGMNVRVGSSYPPLGGPDIFTRLTALLKCIHSSSDPWVCHVSFEHLHPYLDGNGRTGRSLWAWHMLNIGANPFALPFLHRFYYQTLAGME